MKTLKTIVSAAALTLSASAMAQSQPFDYNVDRFADIEVLRYQVPDFESLTLNQKRLVYYLTEAALWGRDILWDQNYKYNLPLRQMIEGVYSNYSGDSNSADFKAFENYLKQVEFANGIHHHYSMDKFTPGFSREWLEAEVAKLGQGAWTPVQTEVMAAIFDPSVAAKRVNQAEGEDLILTSANNLYEGVTQQEVEDFTPPRKIPTTPPRCRTASTPASPKRTARSWNRSTNLTASTQKPSPASSKISQRPWHMPRTTTSA